MKWPKIGTRVIVTWLDCAGYIGEDLRNAKPLECWSEGVLVKSEKDFAVIASSQYKDGSGDFTVLIKGCCLRLKRLPKC